MKIGLIVPMGMSAPIATEAVAWIEGVDRRIHELVLVGTSNPEVKNNISFAETAIRVNRPHIRISQWNLPFEDTENNQDTIVFMRETGVLIRRLQDDMGCPEVHLCISGGRKSMTAAASLLGPFFTLSSIFHLIHPDVATVNIALEKIKFHIETLASMEGKDRIEYYQNRRETFDPVMFPPIAMMKCVELFYLPYPREILGKVLLLLKQGNVPIDEARGVLGHAMLMDLKRADIIEMTGREMFPTPKGDTLISIFRH